MADPEAFAAFRRAIDEGEIDDFTERVPVPTDKRGRRKWEAPTAGLAFDLEGPDCQAVTMAPAPDLGSDELDFEMAEVYELALLRDVPFNEFAADGGGSLTDTLDRLNGYDYAADGFPVRPRLTESDGTLGKGTVFRGSSPGVEDGPYLSQFLLIGNDSQPDPTTVDQGLVKYGAINISQQVVRAEDGDDYMQGWDDWIAVQNGINVNGGGPGQSFTADRRFIHTPRDLATYVHFDALYEAYLNACLMLLGMGTPVDPGFSHLAGGRRAFSGGATRDLNAGGFALYGGPHILTLVTEVATRALKAARYQKFNLHLRARPEALAARLDSVDPKEGAGRVKMETAHPALGAELQGMSTRIDPTLTAVRAFNNADSHDTVLLPMAFQEGSPMHPSYAAGHATVAGACVTILKAFFDTSTPLVSRKGKGGDRSGIGFLGRATHKGTRDSYLHYVTNGDGTSLSAKRRKTPLLLEGELNKLAANISIGRNMAGVHYYSDYYDSLRMGEAIAIGMLEEQALGYPTDPFVMSVPTFDGDLVRIGAR